MNPVGIRLMAHSRGNLVTVARLKGMIELLTLEEQIQLAVRLPETMTDHILRLADNGRREYFDWATDVKPSPDTND